MHQHKPEYYSVAFKVSHPPLFFGASGSASPGPFISLLVF